MVYEDEITVEVNTTEDNLKKILENNNFKVKETYTLRDIYMIKKDFIINNNYLEALKNSILIRNVVEKDKETKKIVYKYKEYNTNGEIIKQRKTSCYIESIEEAKNLFEAIGYKTLIKINNNSIVYEKDKTELCIQSVNDKHLYIELENTNNKYKNIEEMKEEILKHNIPIKDNNFFVKKAEIELREILG